MTAEWTVPDGLALVKPDPGDIIALAPSDSASGMKEVDFAASYLSPAAHAIIKAVNGKGGAAPACSEPRHIHTNFI